MLCPTNGVAFAQMAGHYYQQSQSLDSRAIAQADWASAQAVKFAPCDARAWHYRRQTLERSESWALLLAEAEQAIREQPVNPCAWYAKARALEAFGQFEAVRTACNRALESWAEDAGFHWDKPLRSDILGKRALAHRRLGNLAAAATDNLAAYELAARDTNASAGLVDLSAFYNGGADGEFPGEVQRLAGIEFDFRGWIHLDMRRADPRVTHLPERVNDIPIGRPCHRLHFLHTAGHSSALPRDAEGRRAEKFHVPPGTPIGRYLIHYADGSEASVPVLYGRDVRDYWHYPESAPDDRDLTVAWTSSSALSRQHGAATRLYRSTWENPRPEIAIRRLDFIHGQTHAVPILVAITAEP
jgi:hypothetical protein